MRNLMRFDLRDSAVALRVSRALLGLSVAGGLAMASAPFRGESDRRKDRAAGGVAEVENRAPDVAALTDANNDDQPLIERNPFVSKDESSLGGLIGKAPDLVPANVAATAPARPPDAPQLLGTVVDDIGGSTAIVSLGTGTPRAVRLGGHVGNYRVDSISPGIAVMIDSSGHTLILRLHSRS